MKIQRNTRKLVAGLVLVSQAFVASLWAQDVLPRLDPKFKGTIGQTYKDSTPDKIPLTKAPAGAPNVLFIMIDDAGFRRLEHLWWPDSHAEP
jgi:hypothetical protein